MPHPTYSFVSLAVWKVLEINMITCMKSVHYYMVDTEIVPVTLFPIVQQMQYLEAKHTYHFPGRILIWD